MRTAWTRPGRMVSAVVCTSPDRSRRPSGASATTVPNSPLYRRHTAMTMPSPTGSKEAKTPGWPDTAAAAASPAIAMAATAPVLLSTTATARRPELTRNSSRSVPGDTWPRAVPAPDSAGAAGEAGEAGAAATSAPGALVIDRSVRRSCSASARRRQASRPPEESPPAIRSRSSASPSTRASPVWTTSIAWTWDSGMRSDLRRSRPVSMSSTPPVTCHRVTSQLTTPATSTTATMIRSVTRSLPACFRLANSSRMTRMPIPTRCRPPRTRGESGCRRCQPSTSRDGRPGGPGGAGAGLVTARPPATHRARPAGRAAAPPRPAPGPGCGRRWPPRRCASAPWPARGSARPARPSRR
jgi:hypothetical protein